MEMITNQMFIIILFDPLQRSVWQTSQNSECSVLILHGLRLSPSRVHEPVWKLKFIIILLVMSTFCFLGKLTSDLFYTLDVDDVFHTNTFGSNSLLQSSWFRAFLSLFMIQWNRKFIFSKELTYFSLQVFCVLTLCVSRENTTVTS